MPPKGGPPPGQPPGIPPQFPRFMELPPEVRIIIYALAIGPRILTIRPPAQGQGRGAMALANSLTAPGLLLVNHEARDEVLESYPILFPTLLPGLRVNAAIDSFLFDNRRTLEGYFRGWNGRVTANQAIQESVLLRHLILIDWEYYNSYTKITSFTGLETLQIQLRHYIGETQASRRTNESSMRFNLNFLFDLMEAEGFIGAGRPTITFLTRAEVDTMLGRPTDPGEQYGPPPPPGPPENSNNSVVTPVVPGPATTTQLPPGNPGDAASALPSPTSPGSPVIPRPTDSTGG